MKIQILITSLALALGISSPLLSSNTVTPSEIYSYFQISNSMKFNMQVLALVIHQNTGVNPVQTIDESLELKSLYTPQFNIFRTPPLFDIYYRELEAHLFNVIKSLALRYEKLSFLITSDEKLHQEVQKALNVCLLDNYYPELGLSKNKAAVFYLAGAGTGVVATLIVGYLALLYFNPFDGFYGGRKSA